MLKVGLIGLGNMGKLHLMNCLHIDNVEVTAVADKSKRALKWAKSIGIKNLFTDYRDLFAKSEVEAVIIALPNFLHLESVQLALEAGTDVFIEKPLANTVKECKEIVRSVEKSGRILMVGHYMRFMDAIEKMKKALDEGRIGDLEVVTIEQILNGPFTHGATPRPVPEWWFKPEKAGGGVLLDLGYHLVDLFRFFVGEEASVLFSYFTNKFNLPVEDGAILMLSSRVSNIRGIINVGWFQKSVFPDYNFRLILHGCAGYIASYNLTPKNLYLHALKEGMKNFLRKVARKRIRPLSYTYYYEAYYKELQHFFNCVENNTKPLVSEVDGLKTVELIEEGYKIFSKKKRK